MEGIRNWEFGIRVIVEKLISSERHFQIVKLPNCQIVLSNIKLKYGTVITIVGFNILDVSGVHHCLPDIEKICLEAHFEFVG